MCGFSGKTRLFVWVQCEEKTIGAFSNDEFLRPWLDDHLVRRFIRQEPNCGAVHS